MEPRCAREGTHACRNVASHRARWPWLRGVPYAAHVADPPSPSALPPRRDVVMAFAASLRGLAPPAMFAAADRRHETLWEAFTQKKARAVEALPWGARALVAARGRLALLLDGIGLTNRANAVRRGLYRGLDLQAEARDLEEVAAGYRAALEERLGGGLLGGARLRLFRHAGNPEAGSIARTGALAHHGGLDHLSFSLYQVEKYMDRPVLLVLDLTGNVRARLRALAYVSLAFGAPGSCPALREAWAGAKSWSMAKECEVRLRAPVPVSGLDLAVRMKEPPTALAWRSLRRLCGRRKATVPGSWPPDL